MEYIMTVVNDTLNSLAKKTNTSVDKILNVNPLSNMVVDKSQYLSIPSYTKLGVVFNKYVTEPGDTIESIGMKHKISPYYWMRFNNVNGLKLSPNQKINLVGKDSSEMDTENRNKKTYVVLGEDTAELILAKTGLSCFDLVKKNEKEWLKEGNTINI